MAELNSSEEPIVLPHKRKQPSQTLDDDSTKKLRLDNQPPAAVEQKPINDKHADEEEDYELDSDDEDEVENFNGEDEIDRKGKGITKDDKGKGKMIEESEDEDADDSSDEDGGASESDGDDDLSDDPLAEVDLDNILPSRTRHRTAPRGVRMSGDEFTDGKQNDA